MHSVFIQGQRGETLRFTAAPIVIDHRLLEILASFNKNAVWRFLSFRCYMLILSQHVNFQWQDTWILLLLIMFYKLVFGWKTRCAALKYVLTIAYVWSSQSYILISVPYSFPGSSSLFSSSLVVEQPWACFTSADWLWKTPMSRKCRPDCREILFSFCICVLTCIFYGQTKCWRSTFTVFLSDGIARITQSHGTKWSPINSTKYEQYKVLSIIYTNIIQIFFT